MNQQPSLNGEVTIEGGHGHLFYQRRFAQAPARVWAAITDPKEMAGWFMASDVKIDGRVGGSVEMAAGPGHIRSRGRILAWDPPRAYEYEWITDPSEHIPSGENSTVRWELAASKGGTLLTLRHSRLTQATATGFGPGWHAFLDRMSAQLSGGPLPDWRERFEALQSSYPGWAK